MNNTERKTEKGNVLVNDEYKYKKITKDSPFGIKCFLINKSAGVCYPGTLSSKDTFATHYAPMSTFDENEE